MCLFIAIPTEEGYILGSQRDDQADRKTSDEVIFDQSNKIYYVQDQVGGGTWFAYHVDGIYAVLLNKSPSLSNHPGLKTRGSLPLQCMDLFSTTKNLVDVMDIISASNLREYNSFLLSMGMLDGDKLIHIVLQWDAIHTKVTKEYCTGPIFLSASTLYTIDADRKRRQLSHGLHNKEQVQYFLHDKLYDTLSDSCIEKKGVISKSRTIVEYDKEPHIIRHSYEIFS